MTKIWSLLLTICFVLSNLLPAWAEETAKDNLSFELEQIVVTAAKREQLVKDTPANVAVVTKEDLKKAGARSFDDALKLIPGVLVNRPQGQAIGIPQSISIRGVYGPDRTLLLVDGMPINSPVTGFVNLNIVPLESVERIEVIKGGYSALYGSNALGGIVNIITKAGKEGKKTNFQVEKGNFGTYNYLVSTQGNNNKTSYNLSIEKNHTDNFLYNDERYVGGMYQSPPRPDNTYDMYWKYTKQDGYNLDYDGLKINGKWKYQQNDKTTWNFISGYSKNENGNGRLEHIPNADYENKTEQYYGGMEYKTILGNQLITTIKLYQTNQETENKGEYGLTSGMPPVTNYVRSLREVNGKARKAELQMEKAVNEKNYLTFGLDKVWNEADWEMTDSANSNLYTPTQASDNNWAFYLQDEMKLNAKTDLVLGGRYDKHSKFGDNFSPKAGVLHRLNEKIILRANAGQSFKAPTLEELFSPKWKMGSGYNNPNPALQPEKVDSYDFGIEKSFNEKSKGTLTFFQNKMKDFIVLTKTSGMDSQYQNVGSAKAQGMELGLTNKIDDHWSSSISYTYNDLKDSKSKKRLDGYALHTGTVGLYYTSKYQDNNKFTAGLIAKMSSDKNNTSTKTTYRKIMGPPVKLGEEKIIYTYGGTTLDLNLNWQNKNGNGWFINVQNLTDKEYAEGANECLPGRAVLAGANFAF